MAATDSRPIPLKNTALRVYLPIVDADGDLVTGATALDSEVSIDGAAFADCTNEATEIGTSGIYFLDLTAAECNGDAIVVIVKTSSAGAKTTPIIFYPQENSDIKVAVTHWVATAVATPTTNGVPEVDVTHWLGAAAPAMTGDAFARLGAPAGASVSADIAAIEAQTDDIGAAGAGLTAADDAILAILGTPAGVSLSADVAAVKAQTAAIETDTTEIGVAGAGLTNINLPDQTMNITGNVTGNLSGSVGSVTGAVGSVTGNVGGNVVGSVASVAVGGIAATSFAAGAIDAAATAADFVNEIWAKAAAEPAGPPAVTAAAIDILSWILVLSRNKITQTATTQLVRNDADTATIATSTHSDDATTHIRGEFA